MQTFLCTFLAAVLATIHTVSYGQTTPHSFKKQLLGPEINSNAPEIQPRITPDGNSLYFVRTTSGETPDAPANQDIYMSTQNAQAIWSSAVPAAEPINTHWNDGVCGVFPGNQKLILNGRYYPDGTKLMGLSLTEFRQGKWSFPINQKIVGLDAEADFANFFVSMDGKTMIIELNRKDSYGRQDLYVSLLTGTNQWSEPLNLGDQINTPAFEFAPFLAADNRTLYFSSNRPGGYGNADIWMASRLDDTWQTWSDPVNLGNKINTSGFEAYFSLPANGNIAFFAADSDLSGNSDIYTVVLPEEFLPQPITWMQGQLIDHVTGKSVAGKIQCFLLPDRKLYSEIIVSELSPEYNLLLPGNQKYEILVSADHFIAARTLIYPQNRLRCQVKKSDIVLMPITENGVISLHNLKFENSSKLNLEKSSEAEIQTIASILKNNPDIQLEIPDTDADISGKRISKRKHQKRMQTIIQKFIVKGIKSERIQLPEYRKTIAVKSVPDQEP